MHYFLKSTELRDYTTKHKCIVHKVVDTNKLLVELQPSIPKFVYDSEEDIDLIVLAPRYTDQSLTPDISEWPARVNMCLPKSPGDWELGPWELLDIGELTRTC